MKKQIPGLILVSTLFLGLLLRILFLRHHDLWFDESFSYFIAKQPFLSLIKATAADNNPPLYYLLLHGWMIVFGNAVISLRILSLLIDVFGSFIFYFLTKQLFGRSTAFTALYFFVFSPLMIYFSAESRMYSLFVLFTLLIVFYFANFLSKPSYTNQILFLFFFTLALYTHYYTALLVVPLIYIVFQQKPKLLMTIIKLFSIALLLFLPWILYYFSYSHPLVFATQSTIALPATFASFVLGGTGVVTLRTFFMASQFAVRLFFLFCVVCMFYGSLRGIGVAFSSKNGRLIVSLFFWPLIILTTLNFFIPVYSVRSTVFLAPYFFILISLALSKFTTTQRKLISITSCFVFILITIILLTNSLFRGPSLQTTAEGLMADRPVFHTSVLTYYPYRYYQHNITNSLLINNPLSPTTVDIIGGNVTQTPSSEQQFVLVDIAYGADPGAVNDVLDEIHKKYFLRKKVTRGIIDLYYFEKTGN